MRRRTNRTQPAWMDSLSVTPSAEGVPASGEMAALTRAYNWAATPLGPPDTWPQSLRTTVRILLSSRYAMWMGWGPELTFLYNDAYGRMTLGPKHPWALGQACPGRLGRDLGQRRPPHRARAHYRRGHLG